MQDIKQSWGGGGTLQRKDYIKICVLITVSSGNYNLFQGT